MGKLIISYLSVILFLYSTGLEVLANNGANNNKPPGPDSPFWAARGRRSDKELAVNQFDDLLPPGSLQDADFHSKSELFGPWFSNNGPARGDITSEETIIGRRPWPPGYNFNYFPVPKVEDLPKYMWTSLKKRAGPPDTPIDPFWAARG